MPVWLRKFTYQKITDHYQKERDSYEKANQKGTTVIDKSGMVKDPSVMSQPSRPKKVTY